jgi:hypothetical protein
MKTRPIGITILAILLWLNTGSYLVLAGLAIVRRSSLLRLLHALSPSGAGPVGDPHRNGRPVALVLRDHGWSNLRDGDRILEVMELGTRHDARNHRIVAGANGYRSAPPVRRAGCWRD